jgi:hypothetical protein
MAVTPKVTALESANIDGFENNHIELEVTQSAPIYKFEKFVTLPPNPTPDDIIYQYELFINGQSARLYAEVVVLSKEHLQEIIEPLNMLSDLLNWGTFDNPNDEPPLDIDTVTIPQVLERLNAIENAESLGTFDNPLEPINNDDKLVHIMERIVNCLKLVEWETF